MEGVPDDDPLLVGFGRPRDTIPRVTAVRSTLLAASLAPIRALGRFDDYAAAVPAEHQESLVFGVAGLWHPVELALVHYAAVDSLGLSEAQSVANGESAGSRLNATFLGTILRLAGKAGATPWLPLSQTGKLFERVFRGGGLQVERLGPRLARVEIVGLPLVVSAYFRGATRGQIRAGCTLFCKTYDVQEDGWFEGSGTLRIRVAWT